LGKSENKWLHVLVCYLQGLLAYYEGDIEQAAMLLEKATTLAGEGQYKPDLARSLMSLGRVRLKLGEIGLATELLRESLSRFRDIGNKLGLATTLEALASMRLTQEDSASAVRLYAAAHTLRQALGAPLPPIDHDAYNAAVATSRAQLGDDVFADLWARAAARPFNEVVEEILMASDAG
jgi:tetratricopeptide (TPR) repeat protein